MMATNKQTHDKSAIFRLSISSCLDELEKSAKFVRDISHEANLSKRETYDLMLIMSEAVTNAVIHGNKLSPTKKVRIRCEVEETKFFLRVEDQGNGFSPTEIPNPLDKENLLKPSGRGIFLIQKLSEEFHYSFSKKGTSLNIVFKRRNK